MSKLKYILLFAIGFATFKVNSQMCIGEPGKVKWQCWQNIFDDEIGEVFALEYFPNKPNFTEIINNLRTPVNFDNYIAGRVSGFISVPQTDVVTFNITGDDKLRFYLSSDDTKENLGLIAHTDQWTGIDEHDKFPTQTSNPISLSAGEYYYFEMIYVEAWGGDHMSVFWKTINDNPNEWRLINSNFLYDVGCLPSLCPERGTSCDDGDASTMDDKEDGFCNCMGKPTEPNSCIGERGLINKFRFENIPGGDLNDLYGSTNFPGTPTTSISFDYLGMPWSNEVNDFGSLIQGYITVPVSGNYKFNITGNNQSVFFLSSDEKEENKQSHQIFVSSATDPTEHDKYIWQSTSNIYLEENKYYYMEVNHKESTYSEHFSIFWKTPFHEGDSWKRIPSFYLYDYDCEIACVPQGTVCDDGNAFTNNDTYNNNCECTGIPCSGSDCDDPLASYSSYEKCGVTNELDNREDNNWLSCSKINNPNSSRPVSHWIMYDFGQPYVMNESHVWNYNVDGEVDKGFQSVIIDYSIDGTNWDRLGNYNWSLANGSGQYGGFVGPNFSGIVAQYVLITCTDSSPSCKGFGKILINAQFCTNTGQPCNDSNPYTINDAIDFGCQCAGESIVFNECNIDTLNLGNNQIVDDIHSAIDLVKSKNTVGNGNNSSYVIYVSGKEIDLNPGFETVLGSNFEAIIDECNNSNADDEEVVAKSKEPEDFLTVEPIPDSDMQMITFYVAEAGKVNLEILDKGGISIYKMLDVEFKNTGVYQKKFRTKKLGQGVYAVRYANSKINEMEKFVVQ